MLNNEDLMSPVGWLTPPPPSPPSQALLHPAAVDSKDKVYFADFLPLSEEGTFSMFPKPPPPPKTGSISTQAVYCCCSGILSGSL